MALDFESIHYVVQHGQQKVKGKSVHKPFGPPLDGVQIHRKVSPYISSDFPDNLPGPIYTPGWRKRELCPRTSHIHLTRSWTQTSTQNSVHWQVEHCVFSLGVATPSPKVAQGLPCLYFTFGGEGVATCRLLHLPQVAKKTVLYISDPFCYAIFTWSPGRATSPHLSSSHITLGLESLYILYPCLFKKVDTHSAASSPQ